MLPHRSKVVSGNGALGQQVVLCTSFQLKPPLFTLTCFVCFGVRKVSVLSVWMDADDAIVDERQFCLSSSEVLT